MLDLNVRKLSGAFIFLLLCSVNLFAQEDEYLQIVSLISENNATITLSSAGMAEDRDDVYKNAVKSAFYTLFYNGVSGINNNAPLVECENMLYTGTFFNNHYKCQYYISPKESDIRPKKQDGMFRAIYNITIDYARLLDDMRQNRVRDCKKEGNGGNPVSSLTIMTIPYRKNGEDYSSIFQNNPDLRIVVSKVQDGFRSRDIRTVDFEARLDAIRNRTEYEDNAGVAESNDRQKLLAAGTDVYVVVDYTKETVNAGSTIKFILKAYRTETGEPLASKDERIGPKSNTTIDYFCDIAVKNMLPGFLDDIHEKLTSITTNGSSVAINFAIDGNSAMTMSSQVGPNNYSLSNVIRQWIRRNAHNGDYHLQGIMEETMIFDYVMMPPVDADGIKMDAAQYAFLIESYLREEMGVDCSSRVEGNNILFTIY